MSKETHIPILRLGEEYHSLDTVELESSADNTVYTHTANPGLIRRDILDLEKSKAALDAVPAETLAGYCEAAAELFLHEELPVGNSTQSPQDYIESLSALTKLPPHTGENEHGKGSRRDVADPHGDWWIDPESSAGAF